MIDRLIKNSHQAYLYLENNQIYDMFMVLYPRMKDNELVKALCRDIERIYYDIEQSE